MGDSHAAEVQAELQQYLSSKNINSLFIQIVESLLIEKPENPIAFMVEYLLKQFPNETKDFQRLLSPFLLLLLTAPLKAADRDRREEALPRDEGGGSYAFCSSRCLRDRDPQGNKARSRV